MRVCATFAIVVMGLLSSIVVLTSRENGAPGVFAVGAETAVPTDTPQPDTATPTPTDTATATPTDTPLPDTATPTFTSTGTATATPTDTPLPDTATPTSTTVAATPTSVVASSTPIPTLTGTATATPPPLVTATPNGPGPAANNPMGPRLTPTIAARPPASEAELAGAPAPDQTASPIDRGGSVDPLGEEGNTGPASLSLPTAGSRQVTENAPLPIAALAVLIGAAGALMMTLGGQIWKRAGRVA